MQHSLTKPFRAEYWLFLFISLHVIAWTVTPALIRFNLPMDAIEGAIWGHQLEWGYDKNPFVNAWLTAFATYLSNYSAWIIYLFSQISVAASLFAVWKLAKNMLGSTAAFASVIILEALQYYNLHAIDFNDNTLELGFWSFTIYFFYKALRTPSYSSWLLTGFFASIGMMTKYYTATLLVCMFLFLLFNADNRKQLKTFPPYLCILLFLIICLPHFIWLTSHEFITVKYVFLRTSSIANWATNHLIYPAQFALQQLEVFFPALLLFAIFFFFKRQSANKTSSSTKKFDKQFLLFIGLGPFLLTISFAMIFGITLHAGWGMPLESLWGVLLFTFFPRNISRQKVVVFTFTMIGVMMMLITGYSYNLITSGNKSSANFPGQQIANEMTTIWHEKYGTKLEYVAGPRWLGGNISFYSKDHPQVFMEWNRLYAYWIDVNNMKQKGALFVWNVALQKDLPDEIKSAYPNLEIAEVKTFTWHRENKDKSPFKLGIAFLPPNS